MSVDHPTEMKYVPAIFASLRLPGLVKIQKNYGTSPGSKGKSTIFMAMFNSKL